MTHPSTESTLPSFLVYATTFAHGPPASRLSATQSHQKYRRWREDLLGGKTKSGELRVLCAINNELCVYIFASHCDSVRYVHTDEKVSPFLSREKELCIRGATSD